MSSKREPRFRYWTFTIYAQKKQREDPNIDPGDIEVIEDRDWQEWWIDKLKSEWIDNKLRIEFCVMGKEVCPTTHKRHIQGAVQFINPIGLAGLKKIHPTAHWEVMKGSTMNSLDYCTKEDKDAYVYGRASAKKQGDRTDLKELKKRIEDGEKVDDICMENPSIVHQYGRTLDRIETIVNRKKFRTEMTKGIWIWGRSGTGKSTKAYEGYSPETHYNHEVDDKGWWDGYNGQPTVVINDYRGELPYNKLLKLVDCHPMEVTRRNKEKIPFTSKVVIITSSLPPGRIYKKRELEDGMDQLLRRFEIIHLKEVKDTTWLEKRNKMIEENSEYYLDLIEGTEVDPKMGHRSWGTEVVKGGNTMGPPLTGTSGLGALVPPTFCNLNLVNKIEEDAKMLREEDLAFLIEKLIILKNGRT